MTTAVVEVKKEVKTVKRQKKFRTIATHKDPHWDEIVAICLLKKFGDEKFPGITKARTVYWESGVKTPDGRSIEEWERDGVLVVGLAESRFDEHIKDGDETNKGECAATLVARYLEIEDDPALEKILKYSTAVDTKSVAGPFDISYIIKLLHQKYPNNPSRVIRWAMEVIDVKYGEQLEFLTSTKEDFRKNGKVIDISGPNGRTLRLAVIKSDNPQANKLARSKYGCSADIVVQQRSTGNTQIFTNKKSKLNIDDLVQTIRVKEQQHRRGGFVTSDWKVLASDGTVSGADMWYYLKEGGMLLNGSLSAQNVEPTKIPFGMIINLVNLAMDTNRFDSKRSINCQRGKCTSTKSDTCPLYVYGLHRCRKIRFANHSNNEK